MMIKSFDEWLVVRDTSHPEPEESYEAGIKSATEHFEKEKLDIHAYYAAKLADLFDHPIVEASEENGGKLT